MKVIILTYFIYKRYFMNIVKTFSDFSKFNKCYTICYSYIYCNVQTPTQKKGSP